MADLFQPLVDMPDKKLEVFRDLNLRTRSASVSIRDHILSHVKWQVDGMGVGTSEVLIRPFALLRPG